MKLKKLLALTLAGAVLTASLTACTPLDAAKLVYDSIFGGGSSSTGSGNTGSGNNGSTGGNTGGTTGSGSTAEEAVNLAVAAAYVDYMKKSSYSGETYREIEPVYDIPHLEEFVKAIDEKCTKKSEVNGERWEDTVQNLTKKELEELAAEVGLHKENYENAEAWFQFGNASSGTLDEQLKLLIRKSKWFWDEQSYPCHYQGKAWFDSVVLTRKDGSKYRFLLSICHN